MEADGDGASTSAFNPLDKAGSNVGAPRAIVAGLSHDADEGPGVLVLCSYRESPLLMLLSRALCENQSLRDEKHERRVCMACSTVLMRIDIVSQSLALYE